MKKFLMLIQSLRHRLTTAGTDFTQMWVTSDGKRRKKLQDIMHSIADKTLAAEFSEFDNEPEAKSNNPVLQYYDLSLQRLLDDIPKTVVEPGTVMIWYLYNMGFVIKTPSCCFGVDIHHRHAVKLEPLLDFVATTHAHEDHYNPELLQKMIEKGKSSVSNFFPAKGYTQAAPFTHEFNGVVIHCGESDHNSKLPKFTMPMEIICRTGDKQFVFFTSGDTSDHNFLQKQSDAIDLYAVHPRCIMSASDAAERLNAKVTFIVHLYEMAHEYNRWRWSFKDGRDEVEKFRQQGMTAYIPVWGEKFLWDGEKLNFCRK